MVGTCPTIRLKVPKKVVTLGGVLVKACVCMCYRYAPQSLPQIVDEVFRRYCVLHAVDAIVCVVVVILEYLICGR